MASVYYSVHMPDHYEESKADPTRISTQRSIVLATTLFTGAAGLIYEVTWQQLPYALSSDSYIGFMRDFIRLSIKLEDRPIGYTEIIGW